MPRLRLILTAAAFLITASSVACGDSGGSDEAADGTDGEQTCEPGAVNECACTDGSTSEQICNAEGTGYSPCDCEGSESSDSQDTSGDATDTDATDDASTTDDSTDTVDTTTDADTTDADTTDSTTDATTDGLADPVADIFHPGDGEDRPVNVPIPWIGAATDAEDGDLSGMSLVWSSNLDGEFGTGLMFDEPLTTVGIHVITLTATDSDGQQGTDTIQLNIE